MSSDFEIAVQGGEHGTLRRTLPRTTASPAPSAYGYVQPSPPPPPPPQEQWTRVEQAAPGTDAYERRRCRCSRCWSASRSWITSALGVSILLGAYLALGAVMFAVLGGIENSGPARSAAEAPRRTRPESRNAADALANYDADGQLMERTLATVDRLWSITEDLNILYRDNWTHLARAEMRRYHTELVATLRQIMLEERYSFRQTWTFPMSLLYAITLVTTIGYGFYTPTAPLARGLTTLYSLLGIPLFLLYLSVVGERLARVINRVACSCCCCCCSCCDDGRHRRSTRRPSYRPYGDVPLQPVTYSMGNGHAVAGFDKQTTRHQLPLIEPVPSSDGVVVRPSAQFCCSSAPLTAHGSMPGANQVPVVICAGMVAVFVSLSGLLIVLFEPQLSYADSLHLTVNLLMTLGFAGNLLPGTALEGQQPGSQASLVVVSGLIVAGTTLLSASFNVLLDSFGPRPPKIDGALPAASNHASSATYHHVPSPTR